MNPLHRDAVETLTAWEAPNRAQEALRRDYLTHLATTPSGLFKGDFPDHLTAGVIVVDPERRRVLLNLHRKAQRWFAFGGHLEADDRSLLGAATREGIEESGYPDLALDPIPVHLSRHRVDFCDPRGPVSHLDVRYAARPPAGAEPVVSDESLDVRWFSVDDLPTDEQDVLDLVALALVRFS